MASFTIRDGQVDDLDQIHSMILELGRYLKYQKPPYELNKFKKDSGLLPNQPVKYFHLIVVENNISKELIGYLMYFFLIKTSSGKHFYIEDIFVKESARKTGAGSALIKEASRRATETECLSMKLHVSIFYNNKFHCIKILSFMYSYTDHDILIDLHRF